MSRVLDLKRRWIFLTTLLAVSSAVFGATWLFNNPISAHVEFMEYLKRSNTYIMFFLMITSYIICTVLLFNIIGSAFKINIYMKWFLCLIFLIISPGFVLKDNDFRIWMLLYEHNIFPICSNEGICKYVDVLLSEANNSCNTTASEPHYCIAKSVAYGYCDANILFLPNRAAERTNPDGLFDSYKEETLKDQEVVTLIVAASNNLLVLYRPCAKP